MNIAAPEQITESLCSSIRIYGDVFMRKEIDINTWDRKEHFEFYSNIATPHYCVAFNIDVTNLLAFTRKNKISF